VLLVQAATPAAPAAPVAAPADAPAPATTRSVATTTAATTSTGPTSRPRTTAKEMKVWSELAGKLGFEYSILEGFWSRWSPAELKDLVDSSRIERVGIWVWVHSRNLRAPEQRAELFKRCADAGVVGLKVDFFDHEHKEVVDLYNALLKEAAEHQLLLNFHGANKPTGGNRTWPNELVREAVRGMESRLKERAFHHTVLPFTRFVAGPAEYTTVMFDALRRGDTTFAHQVATPVVFTAPLHTYAAHPQRLIASPATDVIRTIPPIWDETRVLPPSEIGEVAVFARRFQDRWFVAVLNGTTARQVKVPLSFLGPRDKYIATLVRDGTTPETLKVEKDQPLNAADTLTIDLSSGGGFVAALVKKEE
jgi:alpha-glucosidase